MTPDGRIRVHPAILTTLVVLVGWLLSAYAADTSAKSALNARVSVLESQYQTLHSDISEIRSDVKELLKRQ